MSDFNWRKAIEGFQLSLRSALAAGLSMAAAQLLELQYPIYALLAAVIVTDLKPGQSRKLGLHRLLATLVGAACGATLSPLLPPGPFAVGLSILLAMSICQLLRASDGAKVAGYICGIVVLDHSSEPWHYAFLRSIETALGVGVAWSISHVPKLIRLDDPLQKAQAPMPEKSDS
jgi:uncharacterized membrane protein YgaE (UPF0421/DUF939 family)